MQNKKKYWHVFVLNEKGRALLGEDHLIAYATIKQSEKIEKMLEYKINLCPYGQDYDCKGRLFDRVAGFAEKKDMDAYISEGCPSVLEV